MLVKPITKEILDDIKYSTVVLKSKKGTTNNDDFEKYALKRKEKNIIFLEPLFNENPEEKVTEEELLNGEWCVREVVSYDVIS